MLPPRPTRDIPGRLVTQGDIISYFTGFVDEFNEEIWLTAVVDKTFLTQQRLFPTYYNVTDEQGTNSARSLYQGNPGLSEDTTGGREFEEEPGGREEENGHVTSSINCD